MGRSSEERLSTEGVTVRFDGVTAIEDVDFSVTRDEIVGLIGPNGAGKTTLVNVVTGLQRVDAGAVHLGDDDITAWSSPRRARAGLGRTFQGARLFDRLSVFENVEVAALSGGLRRREGRAKASELLELLGLQAMAKSEARSLAHGTARKLGVARALALNPSSCSSTSRPQGWTRTSRRSSLPCCSGFATTTGWASWSLSMTFR